MTTTTSTNVPIDAAVHEEAGTSVELFTGAGGLALAMHAAGFRHLLAVEWEKRACATLLGNTADAFSPDAHDPGLDRGSLASHLRRRSDGRLLQMGRSR